MHVFATAAPGSIDLLAEECRVLGLHLEGLFDEGVALDLDASEAARGLVHLRVAETLLLRVAEVPCPHANRLYHEVRDLRWERWFDARTTFSVGIKGVLPDSDEGRELKMAWPGGGPPTRIGPPLRTASFTAEKIAEAIVDRVHMQRGGRPEVVRRDPDIRIVAWFNGEQCTLLLDLAGPPLGRRDRRPEGACLKPTLAATLVACAAWRGNRPLRLPVDRSGILAIEAVQRALRIAPNSRRPFAVERWPHDGERLGGILQQERQRALDHEERALRDAKLDVEVSDHDRGIVRTIKKNIDAAGLSHLVNTERLNARRLPVPPAGSMLLASPPEANRIGDEAAALMYADLGQRWRSFGGSEAWIFSGTADFEVRFGLRPAGIRRLYSGEDALNLLHYRFAGDAQDSAGHNRPERKGEQAT